LVDPKVTSLEKDSRDGSLWVGHQYGGLTRLSHGQFRAYDFKTFGKALISGRIPDIQSGRVDGKACLLVAFYVGAVGVYCGP
jgi:hypothetical protein